MRRVIYSLSIGSLFIYPSWEIELADLYNTYLAQFCKNELENNPQEFLNKLKNTIYIFLNQKIKNNIENLVNYYWDTYHIDETLDMVIIRIIEQYKENTSLWVKIKGSFSSDVAKKLGEEIATKAFTDPALQNALTQLIQSVTSEIISEFKKDLFTIQNNFLTYCIEDFTNGKIDPVLLKIFGNVLQEGTKKGISNLALETDSMGFNIPTKGIIGISFIVVSIRKQLLNYLSRRLASRIATRIAGQVLKRIATRVIPLIGVILTVWDIKDIATGESLFNTLQEVLTSSETKDKFRQEIIKSLKDELTDSANYIAADLSKRLFVAIKTYTEILVKYNELLKEDPLLYNVLNWYAQNGQVDKAQKLLDLALFLKNIKLYNQLENYLTRPQKLDKLLEIYPEFLPVLKYTQSLNDVYRWYQLVDENKKLFIKLVDYEIYKYFNPQEISSDLVQYLLGFSEFSTVKLILKTISLKELNKLKIIPADSLERFIKIFGVKGLKCLSFYADINPSLTKEIVKESLKQEKIFYILCKRDIKEYLQQHPEDFTKVLEVYKSTTNLLGKISVFISTLFGQYPISIVKLLSPGIYYITIAVWTILFVIVFSFIVKFAAFLKYFSKKAKKDPEIFETNPIPKRRTEIASLTSEENPKKKNHGEKGQDNQR